MELSKMDKKWNSVLSFIFSNIKMGWQSFCCDNCYELGDEEDGKIYWLEKYSLCLSLCSECVQIGSEAYAIHDTLGLLNLFIELSEKKHEFIDRQIARVNAIKQLPLQRASGLPSTSVPML